MTNGEIWEANLQKLEKHYQHHHHWQVSFEDDPVLHRWIENLR